MSAALRRASLALALSGAGCPSTAPPRPPPTHVPADPEPPSLGPDVFVQAAGVGATEDEAYAAARAALAEAVLGDATWADRFALELHRRGEDPQRVTPRDEGIEVALGLTRARVSVAVSELENGEPTVQGPAIWREPLSTYLRARLAAHACERRMALFEVECETGQTDEADAAVVAMLEGVVLTPAYPDGVPVDAEGRPLREPVIFALWRGVPLADLPLRVESEDPGAIAEPRLSSDAQGRAQVAMVQGAPLPSMRIVVDTEAMLGPHPAGMPRAALSIEPRALGTRWALVVTRGHNGDPAGQVAEVVQARMRSARLGAPQSLPPRDIEALRTTPPERQGARVSAIADSLSGLVDLMLVLSYETRFASRMGGGRVWYEAEGTLRVFDVWTGRVRTEATATVRADGVGDKGADVAASKKLAGALVDRVIEPLRTP